MMSEQLETVIIGGGHAGLTMSYVLSQAGREHVTLERARVGERWRSERWDSFCFQFPNWTIELPGYKYQCDDPEGFAPGREIVRFLDGYADFIKAPTRCRVEVTSLERAGGSSRYLLSTNTAAIPVFREDTVAKTLPTGELHSRGLSRSSIRCRNTSGKDPKSYSLAPTAVTM
jgi:putative flavoprotein involved in K+ transport